MVRARRAALAAAALSVVLAACGAQSAPPLPEACTGDPGTLVRALRSAPGPVVLPDGTKLSRCVHDADSDADLQNVGVAFHRAAERLKERARAGDAQSATALGYLIGATRTGARRTQGLLAELVRRIEAVGGRLINDDAALQAAVDRGLAAGTQNG